MKIHKKRQTSYYIFFIISIFACLFFAGCKSAEKQKKRNDEKKKNILTLIESEQYSIKINTLIASNGLYYNLPDNKYFINVAEQTITLFLPTFDISFSSLPVINEITLKEEQTINVRSTIFDKSYSIYPLGMQTLHIVIKDEEPNYDISVAVTELGACTIYMKQGYYKNISFLGTLIKNNFK